MKKSFFILVLIRILINISDSLVYICSLWYISEKSPLLLSFAVMCFIMPENFLVFLGPIIDKYSPKKILLKAIIGCFVVISLLGILFQTNSLNDYLLLFLLLLFAIFSTITYPIEEKMIPMIVEKENLVNANSIVEIAYKIVDVLFNGISGILLSIFAISFLYNLNLILLIIPILILKFWKFKDAEVLEDEKYTFSQYKADLMEGFGFIFKKKLLDAIAPLVITNFFISMTAVALPLFAREFENPEITYGILLTVAGFGGLFGAFVSNICNRYFKMGKAITFGLIIQGVFYCLFVVSKGSYLMFFALFISYTFFGITNIMLSSYFQSQVEIDYLGRVNTIIDSLITLAMPVGAFAAGLLIEKFSISPQILMISFGIFCVITGGLYIFNNKIFGYDIKS